MHNFSGCFLFVARPVTKIENRWQSVLTLGCVGNTVHLQDEVIFEKDVANNREQVDQYESEHSRQHDGASITGHTLDYIQQGLFSVYQVKQLQRQSTCYKGFVGLELFFYMILLCLHLLIYLSIYCLTQIVIHALCTVSALEQLRQVYRKHFQIF